MATEFRQSNYSQQSNDSHDCQKSDFVRVMSAFALCWLICVFIIFFHQGQDFDENCDKVGHDGNNVNDVQRVREKDANRGTGRAAQ